MLWPLGRPLLSSHGRRDLGALSRHSYANICRNLTLIPSMIHLTLYAASAALPAPRSGAS